MKREISIFDIMTDKIEPHPQNPRKDLGDLTELCRSIEENGIMQNLTVVPLDNENKRFRCIIGHRRLAAAKKLGLASVPATIAWDMDEKEQIATMIAENMQRSDLTITEQAQAVQLMLDLGEDFESISERTGLSESTVRRRAKLNRYDLADLNKAFGRGASLFEVEKIEKIEDPELQKKVLEKAGTKDFDRAYENAIQELKEKKAVLEIVKLFEDKLGAVRTEETDDMYYGCYISKWSYEYELQNGDPAAVKKFREKYPEDAKFFYVAEERNVCLYYKSQQKGNAKREYDKALKESQERSKRISDVQKSISMRIRKFLADVIKRDNVTETESMKEEIEQIFTETVMRDWSFKNRRERFLSDEQIEERVANHFLNFALYSIFNELWTDQINTFGEQGGKVMPTNSTQRMYKVLEDLGYEKTEEEKRFYSGKHECFKKSKEENEK